MHSLQSFLPSRLIKAKQKLSLNEINGLFNVELEPTTGEPNLVMFFALAHSSQKSLNPFNQLTQNKIVSLICKYIFSLNLNNIKVWGWVMNSGDFGKNLTKNAGSEI